MSPTKLKEIIKDKGIKQSWIADKISVSKQHLSNYINGRYQLSQSKIHRLEELLGKHNLIKREF